MNKSTGRREFLRNTSLATIGFYAGGTRVAAADQSPHDKLNIGVIGVNHRGASNMNSVGSENIVALCDIDENYLAEAAKKHPAAKTYVDWRKMVDQKDLDAVVISSADQVHALASNWAMKRGLSVYCEKPLAHSVHEARTVRETYLANQNKLATQLGTQIHAGDNYRRVVELIQSKAIGEVREAHAWCGRHGPGGGLPEGEEPVPPHLHWDLWLGPAPWRPYNKQYLPGNLTWNRWWDFGNGTLGDMGSHVIDLPFWALKLRHPTTVEAHGDPQPASPYTNAKWMIVAWEHPATDERAAVKLTWYDGIQRPESPEGYDLSKWGLGVLFKGDRGMLLADYGKHILLPEDEFADFRRPEPSIPSSLGHHKEWIHACKTGVPTLCNFDYSGLLIEHNLLGNVAYRVGQKLQWDPVRLKATNCPEADQYIRREYREGWTL
ncbi:MAG: Gfo/Idh/MocA family oxidoreductase [Pirellulales bacterium]|nr:Gfo/Idh/MocA family oxidoreductase [Pirellulales bacterium]